ncbi:hypothetical protein PUR29_32980 [Methylobacterium ajmalii]|uniref:Uncharacterized protein n=1 Tax=Methylobacterium ajmalii TaxID=2738439 RepID=A0ABV0A355_9HYPH
MLSPCAPGHSAAVLFALVMLSGILGAFALRFMVWRAECRHHRERGSYVAAHVARLRRRTAVLRGA